MEKLEFGPKFRSRVKMMLNGSKSAIKTNGYISNFFNLTRSVKQGCPIAPLLYIIQAEAMSSAIRSNQSIEGIRLPQIDHTPIKESKVNQFVDDTQLFCKNEKSLVPIFRTLTLYEEASGAKLNKSKTTGLCIGKLKNTKPSFSEILWTKNYVKTLGIHHGYNIDVSNIYNNIIEKINSILNKWRKRTLTLQGKVLIIKTFVISKILYEAEINGIPEQYIKIIESIMKNFLWDGKQPKISMKTCFLHRDDGGLGLPNLRTIVKCLNIKSIYNIIHSDPCHWNIIGKYYLKSLDIKYGTEFFLCYCSSVNGETETLRYKNIPFYRRALEDWMEFRKLFNKEVNDISIFGNHYITHNNKPIFFKSFTNSKLLFIKDIFDYESNSIKNQSEIFNKLIDKRNWLAELYILGTAIKRFVETRATEIESANEHIRFRKLELTNSKGMSLNGTLKLRQLIKPFNCKTNLLNCEDKWNKTFRDYSNITLNNLWSIIYRSKASANAKQLQFKINHQIIFTEHKLQLMRLSDGLCTLCNTERETLNHLFYNCVNAKQVWDKIMPEIETYCINSLHREINNLDAIAMLGILNFGAKARIINTLIFETKWFIWKNRNHVKYGKAQSEHISLYSKIKKAVKTNIQLSKNEYLIDEYRNFFDAD